MNAGQIAGLPHGYSDGCRNGNRSCAELGRNWNAMGFLDRLKHEGQNIAGGAKRGAGRVRGDKPQENAGKRDQKASELKKAGDHIKDAFKKK
jgi:uncharacterized protein YjbJ (UPF0337 family)